MVVFSEKCIRLDLCAGVMVTHFLLSMGTLAESVIEGLSQVSRDTEDKGHCSQHREPG